MSQPVQILGTTLEGGGQLLRIAVSISALTKTPIHINKIRGRRSGARGLKQQHLACVKWLSTASNAQTIGAEKKSLELDFRPLESIRNLHIEEHVDIGSPGSLSLIFQAVLPFLLFSPGPNNETRHITIKGGINVDLSPSLEYVQQVLVPTLTLIGIPPVVVSLKKREWTHTNEATGSVNYTLQPLQSGTTLPAFTLKDRGLVTKIHATIFCPTRYQPELHNLILSVVSEYIKLGHLTFAEDALDSNHENPPVDFTIEPPGSTKTIYVLLVAHTTTGHRLGRDQYFSKLKLSRSHHASTNSSSQKASRNSASGRNRRPGTGVDAVISEALVTLAESVVGDLADELAHGGCVDTYMRDQLVVYQALAQGRSYVDGGRVEGEVEGEQRVREGSLHAKTAEWVCKELLGQLGMTFNGEGACEGVGWVAGEERRRQENEKSKSAAGAERGKSEVKYLAEGLESTSLA